MRNLGPPDRVPDSTQRQMKNGTKKRPGGRSSPAAARSLRAQKLGRVALENRRPTWLSRGPGLSRSQKATYRRLGAAQGVGGTRIRKTRDCDGRAGQISGPTRRDGDGSGRRAISSPSGSTRWVRSPSRSCSSSASPPPVLVFPKGGDHAGTGIDPIALGGFSKIGLSSDQAPFRIRRDSRNEEGVPWQA